MDDQSYFTVDGNAMSGNSKFLMSLKSEATEDVKFIRKTVFPAKVLLWLAVSESVIGRPVLQSTKKCTNPNVYQYVINLSKSPQKQKNKRLTDTPDRKCLGGLERPTFSRPTF
jgi:hypothetical protein